MLTRAGPIPRGGSRRYRRPAGSSPATSCSTASFSRRVISSPSAAQGSPPRARWNQAALFRSRLRHLHNSQVAQSSKGFGGGFQKILDIRRLVAASGPDPTHCVRTSCVPASQDPPEWLSPIIAGCCEPLVPIRDIARREPKHRFSHLPWRHPPDHFDRHARLDVLPGSARPQPYGTIPRGWPANERLVALAGVRPSPWDRKPEFDHAAAP